MPQTRKSQISLSDTSYYHCVSRCVRRTFLCGFDKYTGQSYEHRRGWVEDRLLFLSTVFAIDICAYAVMSNHTHLVLHVDKARAMSWGVDEVLTRYHLIHKGTLLTQRYLVGDQLSAAERITFNETADIYRRRLYDISWLMRDLNENIARQANKEDGCTGRFWEGRFKSQALLDESALLACMAYVDLNPVRASIEESVQTSHYTSIKMRTVALKAREQQPKNLMPFVGNHRINMPKGIAFALKDYCELVDATGNQIRYSKKSYLEQKQSPLLTSLGLTVEQWMSLTTEFEKHFFSAAGAEQIMHVFKRHTQHQRLRGMSKAKALLNRS